MYTVTLAVCPVLARCTRPSAKSDTRASGGAADESYRRHRGAVASFRRSERLSDRMRVYLLEATPPFGGGVRQITTRGPTGSPAPGMQGICCCRMAQPTMAVARQERLGNVWTSSSTSAGRPRPPARSARCGATVSLWAARPASTPSTPAPTTWVGQYQVTSIGHPRISYFDNIRIGMSYAAVDPSR